MELVSRDGYAAWQETFLAILGDDGIRMNSLEVDLGVLDDRSD